MHVGPRTGFPHDRSGAADMIRVAVSENQVLDLVWRTAKLADRPEGRVAWSDQRKRSQILALKSASGSVSRLVGRVI
jgi:hypothetical protein